MIESNHDLKARETALRTLVRHETDHAYLKLAFSTLNHKLGMSDRSLALQLANGSIRYLKTIDWILDHFSSYPVDSYTPWIRNILRMGTYQIVYLNRVPGYAVVDTAVKLARRFGHRGVTGLVNAVLRNIIRNVSNLSWPDRQSDPTGFLSLKYSYPEWMVKRAVQRYGFAGAESWCLAGNIAPQVTIRPNRLKVSPDNLAAALDNEGIQTDSSANIPEMLVLKSASVLLTDTSLYKEGYFTIQGESSALAAYLLEVSENDCVVDMCSAPGGKTTHLGELMKNEGLICAIDIHENRLKLVRKSAERLGLKNITTIHADSRHLDCNTVDSPHAILLDSPCSGLGVIRRLPELKWRRKEEDLVAFKILQGQLLDSAYNLLDKKGRILYAVCSNEPEETDQVIADFVQRTKHVKLVSRSQLLPENLRKSEGNQGCITLLPHKNNMDGFFYAFMEKNL